MIRREVTDATIGPAWILISQVDHARLAGELARDWQTPLIMWPEVNAELLATIDHHDDGWLDWEASPRVDPIKQRPLQFIEMPLDQSLVIWQRSIDQCRAYGFLASWLVSGHFSALLRHSNAWQRTDHPQATIAADFLRRQDMDRIGWFRQWQHRDPRRNALSVAETCLRWLQFFDALSLWLCCAPRTNVERMQCVEPAELELRPSSAGLIDMSPWPLRVRSVRHSVRGRHIAVGQYTEAQSLGPIGEPVELSWQLSAS